MTIFLSDSFGDLYKQKNPEAKAQKIADLDLVLTDIALEKSGKLYGLTFDTLYIVNKKSGDLTHVADLDISGANALEIDKEGNAYVASDDDGGIYKLNLKNGSVKLFADAEDLSSAGDLLRDGKFLYYSTGDESIVRINVKNGSERIYDHDIDDLYALAEYKGSVYGYADDDVYRFNSKSGDFKQVNDLSKGEIGQIFGAADDIF